MIKLVSLSILALSLTFDNGQWPKKRSVKLYKNKYYYNYKVFEQHPNIKELIKILNEDSIYNMANQLDTLPEEVKLFYKQTNPEFNYRIAKPSEEYNNTDILDETLPNSRLIFAYLNRSYYIYTEETGKGLFKPYFTMTFFKFHNGKIIDCIVLSTLDKKILYDKYDKEYFTNVDSIKRFIEGYKNYQKKRTRQTEIF